jgi:NADH:ubiquinone oxidoreductase subunit 3 (subunit A)
MFRLFIIRSLTGTKLIRKKELYISEMLFVCTDVILLLFFIILYSNKNNKLFK